MEIMLNPVLTASQSPSSDRLPTAATALKLGGRGEKRILTALLLAILICALSVFSVAPTAAQDRWRDLPAPTGISAVNGANPGEAIISWHPVAGAAFYRIAWIAAADAAALTENDGDWLKAVAYANIAAVAVIDADADADADAVSQHTLTRLNPGVRYIFLVGSLRSQSGTPSWSVPAELNLTLGTLAYDKLINMTVPIGLATNQPGAFGGYTLFTSQQSLNSFLIDSDGQLIHRWDKLLFQVRLLENGNLLGESYGTIYEINPAGNVLWEYHHPDHLHHDFLTLPNGNLLLLVRETKSPADAIAAGANPALVHPDKLEIPAIVEVRPVYPDSAEVVWEWSVWDHLVQDYDPSKANFGIVSRRPELVDINYNLRQASRTERNRKYRMLHANGLDYHPERDQILLSARNFSEIWIIDHSTTTEQAAGHTGGNGGRGGDLLYRWGNPQAYRAGTFADQQLFWQHNPYWIPEGLPGAGNILIFNNGDEYEGRYLDYSSVVEITPPVSGYGYDRHDGGGVRYGPSQPAWTYVAENPPDFISRRLSNAQRLPNGNTMIVSGQSGVIFQVTPQGKTVWRYVSPVGIRGPIYQGDRLVLHRDRQGSGPFWRNSIYRAYRYAPDYPGLQYYDLTPQGTVELYRDGAD